MNLSILILTIITLLALECEGAGKKMICKAIRRVDCKQYKHNANCGTDGITYINACHFAQAKCINESVKVAHEGTCLPSAEKLAGFDLILQVVCNDIKKMDCSRDKTNVLCASDRVSYKNSCYFEKARCDFHPLQVKYEGHCK